MAILFHGIEKKCNANKDGLWLQQTCRFNDILEYVFANFNAKQNVTWYHGGKLEQEGGGWHEGGGGGEPEESL